MMQISYLIFLVGCQNLPVWGDFHLPPIHQDFNCSYYSDLKNANWNFKAHPLHWCLPGMPATADPVPDQQTRTYFYDFLWQTADIDRLYTCVSQMLHNFYEN